jgi:hypothetical protein
MLFVSCERDSKYAPSASQPKPPATSRDTKYPAVIDEKSIPAAPPRDEFQEALSKLPRDGDYYVVNGAFMRAAASKLDHHFLRLDAVLVELGGEFRFSRFESKDRSYPFSVVWGNSNDGEAARAVKAIRGQGADKRNTKFRLWGRWNMQLVKPNYILVDRWEVVDW